MGIFGAAFTWPTNVGVHKMGRKFENILGTVGNTPIVRIGKLAPPEANLFVKI